jgi:branched-chain amino acid transport system permease protein
MLQAIINGLTIGSVYVLLALGLFLIYGVLDIINFAHGELYMIGGYVAFCIITLFSTNFNYLFVVMITIFVCLFIGMILEKGIFRSLRGTSFTNSIVITMGLSIFLSNVALLVFGADPREIKTTYSDLTITFSGLSFSFQRLLIFIVVLFLVAALYLILYKTTLGKIIRATTQDREAASLMGININQVTGITVSIGTALAGAAGVLIGPMFLVYPTMGLLPCLKAFVVVIMGGVGSIRGIIFAGFGLGIIESVVTIYLSSLYKDAIAFIILLIILLVRPSGLVGRAEVG